VPSPSPTKCTPDPLQWPAKRVRKRISDTRIRLYAAIETLPDAVYCRPVEIETPLTEATDGIPGPLVRSSATQLGLLRSATITEETRIGDQLWPVFH